MSTAMTKILAVMTMKSATENESEDLVNVLQNNVEGIVRRKRQ